MPTSPRSGQERPTVPTSPPVRFRRMASGKRTWGLSRTFQGYKASQPSVGGKAPKWVLVNEQDEHDFYIAKLGSVNGRAETFTELFNNHAGHILGFDVAHYGLARLDSLPYFVTKNFRSKEERLVHGSLMIEEVFGTKMETERIHRKTEQAFYGVDFLKDVIFEFCKEDAEAVFAKFIEMLVFDSLIGSMDRHAQNWGVLQKTVLPAKYRFAPIYDSARALLWSLPEHKILEYSSSEAALMRYIDTSKPCIGPPRNHPKVNSCNHFDVVENLAALYPHLLGTPLRKITKGTVRKLAAVLDSFPYCRYLSPQRRKLMLKVLGIRADRIIAISKHLAL